MKYKHSRIGQYLIAGIVYFIIACTGCQGPLKYQLPDLDVDVLTSDYGKWWSYHYNNIDISADFEALNTDGSSLNKKQFFSKLETGGFIPIKLISPGQILFYQLFINNIKNESVSSTIRDEIARYKDYFAMEGMALPDFNFKDLNGNRYTRENTRGKFIILKCWFIHCTKCVEEIPALNQLTGKYKNNRDVLFISLALDKERDFDDFNKRIKFNYPIVPEQKEFMKDVLHINRYPTHIIINKNGEIVRYFTRVQHLEDYLNKNKLTIN